MVVVPISAAMVMPGDRVGADADLAGDAGRDHHEEESEHDDEDGAEQVDADLGQHGEQQRQGHRAGQRDPDRQVEIGAEPGGRLAHAAAQVLEAGAERARRSWAGRGCSAMMPAEATAPAPM